MLDFLQWRILSACAGRIHCRSYGDAYGLYLAAVLKDAVVEMYAAQRHQAQLPARSPIQIEYISWLATRDLNPSMHQTWIP
jgi:hypothetical protein